MRLSIITALAAYVFLAVLLILAPSGQGQAGKTPKPTQPPPDEFRALLREVEEAYKAPLEVDKDIRDELRKLYRQPTPERETKIFKEIRRLYHTTPDHEQAILVEIRRAVENQTAEQEDRLFREIRRGGQLPLGTVPVQIQNEQATKLFRKLDLDGDGFLSLDEMPDNLREQRVRWDRNRDGAIDLDEYLPYFQAHLTLVSEGVASGEIPLRLPKGAAVPVPQARIVETSRPTIARAGHLPSGLPDWFAKYDLDQDGQVGLYEWMKMGRPVEEFLAMDRNGDGFLEAAEVLGYLTKQSRSLASGSPER